MTATFDAPAGALSFTPPVLPEGFPYPEEFQAYLQAKSHWFTPARVHLAMFVWQTPEADLRELSAIQDNYWEEECDGDETETAYRLLVNSTLRQLWDLLGSVSVNRPGDAQFEGYGLNSFRADELVGALSTLVEAIEAIETETGEAARSLSRFVSLINGFYLHSHGWQLDYTPGETIATEGA